MPLKSTHLIIFHSKSTHYKIIPLFSTHLRKFLLSESLSGVNVLATWRHKLEITLAHLSSPPTHHIALTPPRFSAHPQNITPGNSSHSYYTGNTVPSRKDTSDTMPTKKVPRKETERVYLSLCLVSDVLAIWQHKLEITLAHLSSSPTHYITLTTPRGSAHPQNITPGNSSHSYYTNNTVPSC